MDGHPQQINLYNPALRRQREWFTLTNLLALAGVFSVLLVAAGWLLKNQASSLQVNVQALDARLVLARAETAQLSAALAPSASQDAATRELADLRQQVAVRQEVLAALQGGVGVEKLQGQATLGFADYLRGLARQTVSGLWLTGFSVAQGGNGMEVRGRMLGVDRLPEYIRRLNAEASFKGRQFVSLNIARPEPAVVLQGGTPYASFVLTAVAERKDEPKAKEGGR